MSLKICSFLPSGTEILCGLGLSDQIVGISHSCDFPPQVKQKPVLMRSAFNSDLLSSRQIHDTVARLLAQGRDLYQIDIPALKRLAPDLLLGQSLCAACAPTENMIRDLPKEDINPRARFVYLSPHSLEDIFDNIRTVGKAADADEASHKLIYQLRLRATAVQTKTYFLKPKPRVFMLEWLDPLYTAGHWVHDMVEIAGGVMPPAENSKSVACTWDDVARFNPDVLIAAPCGCHLDRARREADLLKNCPNRDKINAFKEGRVYAVDADAYITRPGPRIVDGIELLAHIFHPKSCPWTGPVDAFCRLDV